jgi:Fe-S-cluster containining protein
VWINQSEIEALAKRFSMTVTEFKRTYVRKIGIRFSLKEFPNGDCVFFDSEKRTCQAYEDRPRQCKTWPFWSSNLKTPEAWEQTCAHCPGSGTGKLHTLEQIETQRNVMRV